MSEIKENLDGHQVKKGDTKDSKDHVEGDLLVSLDGPDKRKAKIEAVMREVNCLQFLPSTNITLDPKVNCGGLSRYIHEIIQRTGDILQEKLEKHYCDTGDITSPTYTPDQCFILGIVLNATDFFASNVSHCGGLSSYAYLRWFLTTHISSLEDINNLPAYFVHNNKEDLSFDWREHHHNFAVNVKFTLPSSEAQAINLENPNLDNAIFIDCWAKVYGKEGDIRSTILQHYPYALQKHLQIFKYDFNNLSDLKKFQMKIKNAFDTYCKQTTALFKQELNKRPEIIDASSYSSNDEWYDSFLNRKRKIPIDIKAANEFLHQCYRARDNDYGRSMGVLDKITLLWEHLIGHCSEKSFTEVFLKDNDPKIQEMLKNHPRIRAKQSPAPLTFSTASSAASLTPAPKSAAKAEAPKSTSKKNKKRKGKGKGKGKNH